MPFAFVRFGRIVWCWLLLLASFTPLSPSVCLQLPEILFDLYYYYIRFTHIWILPLLVCFKHLKTFARMHKIGSVCFGRCMCVGVSVIGSDFCLMLKYPKMLQNQCIASVYTLLAILFFYSDFSFRLLLCLWCGSNFQFYYLAKHSNGGKKHDKVRPWHLCNGARMRL